MRAYGEENMGHRSPSRRSSHGVSGMDDLTHVPVGMNRFRAQVIAEACHAAGLKVELLSSDSSGELPLYRLLVRSDDLEQVLAVIEKSDIADGWDQPVPGWPGPTRQRWRRERK